MKILITGGAGFIGSNFVRMMMKRQDEIVVLDNLSYAGRMENLEGVLDRITFIKGDIRNMGNVEKAMKGCDQVVHFAALTHVDRSLSEAGEFIQTDVFGTFNILETARKFDVKRVVHISTDEVYGSIKSGSFKETDALNPRNPYSASKAGAELLCRSYFETYKLPVLITRSSNNYGPNQHPEKFIPKSIVYSIIGKKIPIYGSGENVRDWLYVEDNCEAIETVLQKGELGEVYNIAGKQELQNIFIVNAILRALGKGEETIEFVKDRPGHDLRYSLDISKIEKLGWKPKVNFQEGIERTVSWYRDNRKWWEPVMKTEIDFHKKY
ncbi:MAG: dTDP-glucose 4,6-dehydratase [Candidatus Aenigmatarchaeota archaeon]